MFSFKKTLFAAMLVSTVVGVGVAKADTISIATPTVFDILPSGDSFILSSSNIVTAIGPTPSQIILQAANFLVNYSSGDMSIDSVINQDVTINGITHSVAFNFHTQIGATMDSWTLAPGVTTSFGNVLFTTLANSGSATELGDHNFFVRAQVSAVPEPATYGMLLLGAGLLGVAARRKQG